MNMTTLTLFPEYLVTIPKPAANQLRWRPGRKLALVPKPKGVLSAAISQRDDLAGIVGGANFEEHRVREERY